MEVWSIIILSTHTHYLLQLINSNYPLSLHGVIASIRSREAIASGVGGRNLPAGDRQAPRCLTIFFNALRNRAISHRDQGSILASGLEA